MKYGNSAFQDEMVCVNSRMEDLFQAVKKHGGCRYEGFGDEFYIATAESKLKKLHANYTIWGGYENANRKMICLSEYCEIERTNFPISRVNVLFGKQVSLTHRDFLGSLMALGLERKSIGDIVLYDECKCAIFCKIEVEEYIYANLKNVGKQKVSLFSDNATLIVAQQFDIFNVTVASNRLDCMVSAVAKVSRSDAVMLIKSGKVYVNSLPVFSSTVKVKDLEVLSIRGFGKYKIHDLFSVNKKDRKRFKIEKYK